MLRSGGFLVSCNWYAFDQLLEPRQDWVGSRHGEAVLTFLLVSCVVWKGRQRLKTREGESEIITKYSPTTPVMRAGNISDTKQTLVVSAVLT